MISIQIGFYTNTSQRPILKEIGLFLQQDRGMDKHT